jgi:hypothetical protein
MKELKKTKGAVNNPSTQATLVTRNRKKTPKAIKYNTEI